MHEYTSSPGVEAMVQALYLAGSIRRVIPPPALADLSLISMLACGGA